MTLGMKATNGRFNTGNLVDRTSAIASVRDALLSNECLTLADILPAASDELEHLRKSSLANTVSRHAEARH
jgi:hypothetical protein